MGEISRFLIVIGLAVAATGLVAGLLGKVPFLGKLPGDLVIKRGNFTFYFPITTSILISFAVSIILRLFSKK